MEKKTITPDRTESNRGWPRSVELERNQEVEFVPSNGIPVTVSVHLDSAGRLVLDPVKIRIIKNIGEKDTFPIEASEDETGVDGSHGRGGGTALTVGGGGGAPVLHDGKGDR